MLVVALILANATAKHVQAPSSQFTATIQPEFPSVVYVPPFDWPIQEPEPLAELAPPSPPGVRAAAVETAVPLPLPTPIPPPAPPPPVQDGIPWYVPPHWHERYTSCLSSPDRHTVSEMVWSRSLEAGYEGGWPYGEAMFIVSKEGGDDLCQFNTQGSGACGPFQLLTCPPDGLTPEGQLAGAFAKFRDGGGSFERHWYQWWRR